MKARLEGFGKGIDGTEVEIPDSLATTKSQTDNTHHHHLVAGACVVPNCKDFPQPKTDNTEPTTSELGEIKQIVSDSLHQIRTRALRDAPVYLQHVSSAESDLIQAIEQKYIRRKDLAGLLPEKKPVESTWVVLPTGQTVQDKDTANWYNGYNQAIDDFRQTLNP